MAYVLKKPIIPLLLEPMTWPPDGPMGPTFAPLLYIDFCQPNTNIQNNWDCPEFARLIKQIKKHIRKQKTVRITYTYKLQFAFLHQLKVKVKVWALAIVPLT